jgi:hypothetical protein
MSTVTFSAKLGTSRAGDRTRIWLEGKRLETAGWNAGQHFERRWYDDALTLVQVDAAAFEALPRDARGTVSGKPGRPVIDLVGARIAETFKGERVAVALNKTIRITNEA